VGRSGTFDAIVKSAQSRNTAELGAEGEAGKARKRAIEIASVQHEIGPYHFVVRRPEGLQHVLHSRWANPNTAQRRRTPGKPLHREMLISGGLHFAAIAREQSAQIALVRRSQLRERNSLASAPSRGIARGRNR